MHKKYLEVPNHVSRGADIPQKYKTLYCAPFSGSKTAKAEFTCLILQKFAGGYCNGVSFKPQGPSAPLWV